MTKKPNGYGRDTKQSNDVRGTLTHRTTTDPYRGNKREANAMPAGGGGGIWAQKNKTMAENRARVRGLALGTQAWVQDKIAAGDIDGGMSSNQTGTSIFDPVLCELAYRWFCPPDGHILDPFAGGSVRGIVASHLGRHYTGVELRPEQVAANRAQLSIAKKPQPEWIEGDSRNIPTLLPKHAEFDFVFSCPPYWNLEVYSQDKRDLSTLGAEDFFVAQANIIKAACSRLKRDRFAAWVVGDVRDAKGFYVNLPGRSVAAFEDAGLRLYNECILVTSAGSLAMRTGKQFEASRKLGKTHQNVLVFVKGDPVKATKAIGKVEFGEITETLPAGAPAANGSAPPTSLAAYGREL